MTAEEPPEAWTMQAASSGHAGGRVHGSDINLRAAAQMREYESAADRIAVAGYRRVLDWGCGYGQMTALLAERGVQVSSIDYDPSLAEPVTGALERFPDHEATSTPEPVALPYPDASFDAVLSMGVLEHVNSPEGSLDELHRVLSPGGVVYCHKLPNRASWLEWIARSSDRMYFHGQLPGDRLYTVAEARDLFRRHGFEPLWARRANMLPLTLTGAVARRIARPLWSLNRILSRIPLVNLLATNVELAARRD